MNRDELVSAISDGGYGGTYVDEQAGVIADRVSELLADDSLLAAMMRRVLEGEGGYGYLSVNTAGHPETGPSLTIDLRIDLSPEELALCQRLTQEKP